MGTDLLNIPTLMTRRIQSFICTHSKKKSTSTSYYYRIKRREETDENIFTF